MTAITQIRKRAGLVIAIIGIAIAAFIISDAISNNQFLFQDANNEVGIVDGEEITIEEYQQQLDNSIANYRAQNPNTELDESTRQRLNDQTWERLIYDRMFKKEYADLGVQVSSSELFDMMQGDNIHPQVKQAFTNPQTQQFDKNQLYNFLSNLNSEQMDPQFREQWFAFEESIARERLQQKYFNLVSKSFYINDLEAKEDFTNSNKLVTFKYVSLKASDIPDSTISVEESELKKYYNDHKFDYEQKPNRTVRYVIFDIRPTDEDSLQTKRLLEDIKNDWAQAKDDSLFLARESRDAYDTTYYGPGELSELIRNQLYGEEVGTLYGPYLEEGYYKVAKLLDKKDDSIKYYRASHILIRPEGSTDADSAAAFQEAKELMQRVKDGESFEALAAEFGTDGTAQKGGDLGWFKEGDMVAPFQEAVKKNSKGDLDVVQTRFGAHVIKVTADPSNKVVQIGTIERQVIPSSETIDNADQEAREFRAKVDGEESFEETALELGMNPRVAELTTTTSAIPGFTNPKILVRWAFKGKKGDVSSILDFADKYVVAVITEISETEYEAFESVRNDVEQIVIKEKKLDMMAEKMKEASGGDLETLASTLGTQVRTASQLSFNNTVMPNAGDEPKVVGAAFGMEEGEVSAPIKGQNGVYTIKVEKFASVEVPESLAGTKSKLIKSLESKSQFEVLNTLKEEAEAEDNRYKFF